MGKKEFLKELEKRLAILDEHERKDIINEYSDIIEEKIKHGKKEVEAISEFGNLDELVKEILSAYKINPEYGKKEKEFSDTAKELGNDLDNFIKKGARKLSDAAENVVNDIKNSNADFNIEMIFEILIRIILVLIGLALLRLPFMILGKLGGHLLNFAWQPFDGLFHIFWNLIMWLIYILVCIAIVYYIFRKYFQETVNQKNAKKDEKDKVEEKEIKEEMTQKTEKKTESKPKTVKKKQNSVVYEIFMFFVKAISIIFSIPMIVILIGLCIFLSIDIYFMVKGLWGLGISLLLMTIGLIGLVSYFLSLIYAVAFSDRKIRLIPLFIYLFLSMVGLLMTWDMLWNIEYINDIPKNHSHQTEERYEINVTGPTYFDGYDEKMTIISDDSIRVGTALINVRYYDDYIELKKDEYYITCGEEKCKKFQFFKTYENTNHHYYKKLSKAIIKDLQSNHLYRYRDLFVVSLVVRVNPKDRDYIIEGI